MSYPETIYITRKVRIVISITLTILFLIVAPLMVFYTTGYRYDFEEHKVTQTGVISIDAFPNTATVRLNNVMIEKSLPIRLANKAPGTYRVLMEKDGYHPWEADITVKNRQTSYIKDIVLFKKATASPLLQTQKQLFDVAISYDGNTILTVTENNMIYEINAYDIQRKQTTPILRTKSTIPPQIQWSPYGGTACIQTIEDNKNNLYLISAINLQILATHVFENDVSPLEFLEIEWNYDIFNSVNSSIFTRHKNTIQEISFSEKKQIFEFNEENSVLWYVDRDKRIWIHDTHKKILFQAQTETMIDFSFFEQKKDEFENMKILEMTANTIILKQENKILHMDITDKLHPKIRTFENAHAIFFPKKQEWYVWTPQEIWWIAPQKNSIELMSRMSETIRFVFPFSDVENVIAIATDSKIIGYNPGFFITHTLFEDESATITNMGIHPKSNLIIIGKKNEANEFILETLPY